MSLDLRTQLPEIFPTQGDIRVDEESHLYETFQGDNEVLEEREYTLDKAPITSISEVTGILDGSAYTFTEGTDFELSGDSERIVWKDDPADRPDAGTRFNVTYRCDSIISRYITASEEEFDSVEKELRNVIEAKFIDSAEGDELDELGKIFGTLGKRRGRNDDDYRVYLKSVVQSFVSRGTKSGIRIAVAAALDIPAEDVDIVEDFSNSSYDVSIKPSTPISLELIEEIAEVADPSGVNQGTTNLKIDPDSMAVNDSVSVSEGEVVSDSSGVGDSVTVDGNKTSVNDSSGSSDSVTVDGNKTTVSDSSGADDAVSVTETKVQWNDGNWNSMSWGTDT